MLYIKGSHRIQPSEQSPFFRTRGMIDYLPNAKQINILVPIIPLFGYLGAFFFEAGRFSKLMVPITYIKISLETIILSSVFTFTFIVILSVIYMIFKSSPSNSANQRHAIKGKQGLAIKKASFSETIITSVIMILVFPFILILLTQLSILVTLLVTIGLIVLIVGLVFLPPLIKYPSKNRYKDKFDNYQEYEYQLKIQRAKTQSDKQTKIEIFNLIKTHPLRSYIILSISLTIWSLVAFILGTATMSDATYSVVKYNSKDYINLGLYSNKFILVGIDKTTMVTTSEITFMNDDKNIQINQENIGEINKNSNSN